MSNKPLATITALHREYLLNSELRFQNAVYRDALEQIAADCECDYPPSHGAIKHAARAALDRAFEAASASREDK